MFPAPTDIGLPLQFSSWRPHQPSAILSITDSERRFCGNVLPTGAGKTLTVAGATLLMGWRTAFLTSTKMLQAQYSRDLSDAGLVDIRGQASYRCVAFDDEHRAFRERAWQGCDEGPCRVGHACSRKPERDERDVLKGCESYDAIAVARKATLVTTNYKMWLHAHENGQGLGRFDCLVLDEAHHADKELGDFLSTVLEPADFQLLGSSGESDDVAAWARWAERYVKPVKNALEQRPRSKAEIRKYRHLKRLVSKLEMLRTMTAGDWIAQTQHGGWHFDPVFVARYASMLFRDIPHIVLTSATITRKTTAMLGIGEQELTWHEAPSDFPVARRPVYYVPCVKLDYRSDASQVRLWLATVDNFLRKRRDRKGIIHAVSYARAKQIRDYSEFADAMILHDKHDTQEQVARFKAAGPGAILVSPSVTTGYDFPRCVDPSTRILRADLTYVEAGSLAVGDKVAGFDEFVRIRRGKWGRRYWKEATVTNTEMVKLPSYRLILEDGTILVCSEDHLWLTTRRDKCRSATWVKTKNLRADTTMPSRIARYLPTWTTRTDRLAGFLAGMFDGEGHLYQEAEAKSVHRGRVNLLACTQAFNSAFRGVVESLEQAGFSFKVYDHSVGKKKVAPHYKDTFNIALTDRPSQIRFLGEIRPSRLLPKFKWDRVGALRTIPVGVVHKEFLGDRWVVALSTDTRTFVAEGLGSHNSECEYQILAKIPFPDRRSPVVAARTAHDSTYPAQIAAQEIMQAVGRGMRAADDQCETVIFDSNASWFMRSHRDLFLAWFLAAYQRLETLPDPPPALSGRR